MVKLEDHWKYSVSWYWDPQFQRTMGLIEPKVVIVNQTDNHLTGYIGDANGTILTMYNDEHIVMVKYSYDQGQVTKWFLAGKMHNGWFTVDIPPEYMNAQTVSIYITNHMYVVDAGDSALTPPRVFINSGRIDYRMNSALVNASTSSETNIQSTESAQNCLHPTTSLIDYIVSLVYYASHNQDANQSTRPAALAHAPAICKTL